MAACSSATCRGRICRSWPPSPACPASRSARAEDLAATVAKAVATPGPSLVEVDMTAIGAFPPYAPYNAMGIYAKRAAE